MRKNSIYLAGAISGIPWEKAIEWRDHFVNFTNMLSTNWKCFNPCEHFLEFRSVITDEEAMSYDLDMLRHSRLVVVNMEYNPSSTGTLIELGVAHENRIPVIVIKPDDITLHPWVQTIATHICKSVEDAEIFLVDHYINEV